MLVLVMLTTPTLRLVFTIRFVLNPFCVLKALTNHGKKIQSMTPSLLTMMAMACTSYMPARAQIDQAPTHAILLLVVHRAGITTLSGTPRTT